MHMKLLRRSLFVLAMAAGLLGAPAQAALGPHTTIYEVGPLSATPWQRTPTLVYESFLDIFNFSVPVPLAGATSPVSLSLTPVAPFSLDLDGVSSQLYIYDADNTLVDTATGSGGQSLNRMLGAGNYHLDVSGYGPVGGGYLFSISMVPEPGQWTLLVAGMLMLGFLAWRRKS
jgi:hypothetical protein